jgi:Carbohydrate-selective porin, OprB family
LNRQLNWLTITSGGLFATLLLATGAQAAESLSATSSSATPTIAQSNSSQLIALSKKKKKSFKRRARVKRRVRSKTTATTTPSTPPTEEVTQATPPPAPIEATPPAPITPPPPPEPVTPPPAPVTPPPEPVTPPPAPPEPPKAEAPNQFSTTTKLQGQVIFGVSGTVSGDLSRNTALGNRTRLELKTGIGQGTLTTRLQAVGLGLANNNKNEPALATNTPEGSLSFSDGSTGSSVGIDALKYEFPASPQTTVVVAGNAGASDDFTDTINPYFDGDGASGSISAFGNRPSIYYTLAGTGAGVRHKFSDNLELSLGYLASKGNDPAVGNGLFGGGYGALAQLTFKTGDNSKVGLTYTRSRNVDTGTGSTNANRNVEFGGDSNNFGLQGSFQLSPQLALGGWAGYTQNRPTSGGDRQIWNWAVTAAAPDLGGKGNLAGLLVGQEPRVTFATDGSADTKAGLHLEGFYQFKVSDSLSITPGIIYLTAPNQDANRGSAVIGALRTTFTF